MRILRFLPVFLILSVPGEILAEPFAYIAVPNGFVSVVDIGVSPAVEVASISIGSSGDPYWIASNGLKTVVATTLHGSTGVAVIDAVANTLTGVVAGVGSEPEAVALDGTGATLYVADESGEELFVVDVATLSVSAGPIDISADCSEPENMVISPDDLTLYIACAAGSSSVIAVDTSTFAVTVIFSASGGDAHGVALDPTGTLLYYSDGTDGFQYDLIGGVNTGVTYANCELYNGAVTNDGSRLLCVNEDPNLLIFDTATGTELANVDLRSGSLFFSGTGVAVSPDDSLAVVGGDGSSPQTAKLIDLVSFTNLGDLPVTAGSSTFVSTRGVTFSGLAAPPPPGPAAPIPTLNEWGLILLALLLVMFGLSALRRRSDA
ncbi:MAG: IPTL-CTERM sorting domain-containing protein [Acidobacteriota bacterium]